MTDAEPDGDDDATDRIAAAAADLRREIAEHTDRAVTIVAVTKTFGPEMVDAVRRAGLEDIGENYAQELLAKAAAVTGVRWHFIGALQRNKVRRIAPYVHLWHSLDRPELLAEVARRSPGAAALIQVNVTGASGQAGCDPAAVAGLVAAGVEHGLDVQGFMAIGAPGPPEVARPGFRLLRTLADEHGLAHCSMGMSNDLLVAVEEGATIVRPSEHDSWDLVRRERDYDDRPGGTMASLMKKTLLYLGLGSDEDFEAYDDEMIDDRVEQRPAAAADQRRPERPRPEPARPTSSVSRPTAGGNGVTVRPVPPPTDSGEPRPVSSVVRPLPASSTATPHVTTPDGFNDAQEIGDRFKEKLPVIMNLQPADHQLSRRLIDFASGLCYALDGRMERVADDVYLLIPSDVHLSADDRRRIQSGGLPDA